MRVSIVATSLDGRQPETKSVINMVHRIQNRNPGYSDFSHMSSNTSFSFNNASSSPISHGANALKLENEIANEQLAQTENHANINNQILNDSQIETQSIIEATLINESEKSFTEEVFEKSDVEEDISNDLKEFGVDSEGPDLFNSSSDDTSSDLLSSNEDQDEDDDLEIPAFLRRQKN